MSGPTEAPAARFSIIAPVGEFRGRFVSDPYRLWLPIHDGSGLALRQLTWIGRDVLDGLTPTTGLWVRAEGDALLGIADSPQARLRPDRVAVAKKPDHGLPTAVWEVRVPAPRFRATLDGPLLIEVPLAGLDGGRPATAVLRHSIDAVALRRALRSKLDAEAWRLTGRLAARPHGAVALEVVTIEPEAPRRPDR